MNAGVTTMARPTTPQPAVSGDTAPFFCRRCDNPRPLGIVSPGRYWMRNNGRTVLVEGGMVKVWCEKCGGEHDLDLRLAA